MEASTIGNIRIIDSAYKQFLVSPKFTTIIFTFFISFILACLASIIRGINFLPISNPAELFDHGLTDPILGVVPYHDDENDSESKTLFDSSFESIIVNIESLKSDNKSENIICITSPTPFNGKSTISRNLSESLAKINKKTLLVDADFKRGNVNSIYNVKRITESEYFSIDESNIDQFKITDNLYFIPRVKCKLNSFQFVTSSLIKNN